MSARAPKPSALKASLDIPNRLAVLQEHKPLEAQSTRVAPQARLLSTAPVERHRKTLSLCDAKPETPYTELEPQVRIPWSEACHLGYGVNALTGEHTGTTVFSDNLKPTVKDLQDDFEVGVGATVNVLSPPVGANANITNLLFETTSTSTVLVQYRHEALLTSDSVPHNPSVQKELEKLNSMEFRARYGDYYIAGYDKACSCSMIVECKTDKETVTENHTQEVVALVGKYLNGDIKIGDIETERSSWSLLSVRVDTEGYPDHLNFFNKILDVQNAPQILSEIVENTHEGFPRTAILKHYSTLLTLHHLSRRIDHIPSLTFERARVMRHTYAYLRDCCLLHPALDGFRHDLRAIREVLERFRKLERYLVLAANGSEKAKDVDALMQDLHSRKKRADMLIERYDFIRKIMEMDTRILRAPTNYDKTMPYYRWHCGKTDEVMDNESPSRKQTIDESSELAKSNPFLDKSFGQCHEVFQFRWTTPETTGGSIISSPPKNITFSTRRDTLPPLPPLKKRSLQTYRDAVGWLRRTRRIPEQPSINGKTEALLNTPGQPNGIATDLTFHPCLSNHKPVYILGWTLSCYWPVQGTVPDIRVKHRSILSDRLTISVPNTRPAQWHCTVFYVRQSEYNFSDLLKPRDKSSPSNRTPNWFQRVFGN
ncbi:FHA domain-containing protein [Mycena venus]|uniref:FHA domain-containing protein n=1 Tax=Mycena venus TaxID=2733690 RepID=A0A8H7CY82_9AGAR|nr:FHA domain-containing protein [Mycena venus]